MKKHTEGDKKLGLRDSEFKILAPFPVCSDVEL